MQLNTYFRSSDLCRMRIEPDALTKTQPLADFDAV